LGRVIRAKWLTVAIAGAGDLAGVDTELGVSLVGNCFVLGASVGRACEQTAHLQDGQSCGWTAG